MIYEDNINQNWMKATHPKYGRISKQIKKQTRMEVHLDTVQYHRAPFPYYEDEMGETLCGNGTLEKLGRKLHCWKEYF